MCEGPLPGADDPTSSPTDEDDDALFPPDDDDAVPTSSPTKKMVGTSYCTFAPDNDCYETGWPACCGTGDCPDERPGCEKMVGTSYCTFSPDYDCYETGWPACCGTEDCPDESPGCEITPEPTMSTSPAHITTLSTLHAVVGIIAIISVSCM